METLERYLDQNGIEYHVNADIKPYLTMGIGGNTGLIAVVYSDVHLKDLSVFLQQNREGFNFKYIVLGGGSNVIFSGHSPLLAVIINRTSGIEKVEGSDHLIKVSSGVFLWDLMEWNTRNNIGGMDFLAGIPGTVGGASAVNAGAFGQSISSILDRAEIVTSAGEMKTVDNQYFGFTYRDSTFKHGGDLILRVFLEYAYAENDEIKKKVDEKTNYRKERHPCSDYRSAGCFFKNPVINGEKIPAGRLIETLGFKGVSFNRLRVSQEHANFLINNGEATFEDVNDFEKFIAQNVFREKGIKLEREVIYISPEGVKY